MLSRVLPYTLKADNPYNATVLASLRYNTRIHTHTHTLSSVYMWSRSVLRFVCMYNPDWLCEPDK